MELTKRDSRAVHRRAGGTESCTGVPIPADLWAISEAIPRSRTGGIGREGVENGCFIFCVGVIISKIRKIADAGDASHYPGVTTFDIIR